MTLACTSDVRVALRQLRRRADFRGQAGRGLESQPPAETFRGTDGVEDRVVYSQGFCPICYSEVELERGPGRPVHERWRLATSECATSV